MQSRGHVLLLVSNAPYNRLHLKHHALSTSSANQFLWLMGLIDQPLLEYNPPTCLVKDECLQLLAEANTHVCICAVSPLARSVRWSLRRQSIGITGGSDV